MDAETNASPEPIVILPRRSRRRVGALAYWAGNIALAVGVSILIDALASRLWRETHWNWLPSLSSLLIAAFAFAAPWRMRKKPLNKLRGMVGVALTLSWSLALAQREGLFFAVEQSLP